MQIVELTNKCNNLSALLDISNNKNSSLITLLSQAESEKSIATKQTLWFEEELKRQSEEFYSSRINFQNQIADLQSQLNSKRISDITPLDLDSQRINLLQTQISDLQQKLLDEQQKSLQQRESDAREVNTATKLSELYKKATNEERERNKMLENTVLKLKVFFLFLFKFIQASMTEAQSKFDETTSNLSNKLYDSNQKLEASLAQLDELSKKFDYVCFYLYILF